MAGKRSNHGRHAERTESHPSPTENGRWPAIRKETIIAILGSPVAYYAAFAKVLGGVEAGIFASQFFTGMAKDTTPTVGSTKRRARSRMKPA